ncbi:MAG: hypothetical protein V1664_04350 [Candidatus Uhrbacteria bacterium]
MIKYLFYFLLFFFLAEVETVFFRTLPTPFLFTPLVFSVGLYLYQHRASAVGLWWLLAFGVFLDVWHIGVLPGETIFYVLTSVLVFVLSWRFFTNRSFYGVNMCAFLSLLALQIMHGIGFFFLAWPEPENFPWLNFFWSIFWQEVFLLLLVSFLFFFSDRLRKFFRRFLITSST